VAALEALGEMEQMEAILSFPQLHQPEVAAVVMPQV
jgi:hypothetical protein